MHNIILHLYSKFEQKILILQRAIVIFKIENGRLEELKIIISGQTISFFNEQSGGKLFQLLKDPFL